MRKAVSVVRETGGSRVGGSVENSGEGAKLRKPRISSGSVSSDMRSRPEIRDLKMSHIEEGASAITEVEVSAMGDTLLVRASEAASRVELIHDDGAMKSEGLHSRLRRSQLLQMGFFSSHRLWRSLQV